MSFQNLLFENINYNKAYKRNKYVSGRPWEITCLNSNNKIIFGKRKWCLLAESGTNVMQALTLEWNKNILFWVWNIYSECQSCNRSFNKHTSY